MSWTDRFRSFLSNEQSGRPEREVPGTAKAPTAEKEVKKPAAKPESKVSSLSPADSERLKQEATELDRIQRRRQLSTDKERLETESQAKLAKLDREVPDWRKNLKPELRRAMHLPPQTSQKTTPGREKPIPKVGAPATEGFETKVRKDHFGGQIQNPKVGVPNPVANVSAKPAVTKPIGWVEKEHQRPGPKINDPRASTWVQKEDLRPPKPKPSDPEVRERYLSKEAATDRSNKLKDQKQRLETVQKRNIPAQNATTPAARPQIKPTIGKHTATINAQRRIMPRATTAPAPKPPTPPKPPTRPPTPGGKRK